MAMSTLSQYVASHLCPLPFTLMPSTQYGVSAPGIDTNFAIPNDISDPDSAKRFLTKAIDGAWLSFTLILLKAH